MIERFKVSRRVVLWLGLIALTAFILQLQEARYNNIDPHGTDYHLIEVEKTCRLKQRCQLRKFVEGIELIIQWTKQQSANQYRLTVQHQLSIDRILFADITKKSAKLEAGVISGEVKGKGLSKISSNILQLNKILLKQSQTNMKYILYVFTENAIYEIRLGLLL
ncbi:hypothetical protein MNBD_GAMMA12-1714 [hydrothermal vent metagenome]|uniref:Uncharacterized protein n=1 Tax=hydrothermal vent metagenome TaxID=652676 RepID=A0A3B0Y9U2_9ZZZZ